MYSYNRTAATEPSIREHREAKQSLEKAKAAIEDALSALIQQDYKAAKRLALEATKESNKAAANVAHMGVALENSKHRAA